MSRPVGVAAVGDVNDINTWSNIPYYFWQATVAAGMNSQAWPLKLDVFNSHRKLWNVSQIVLGRGVGGYQYSKSFLDKAEQQIPKDYFSSDVISFNQLFPRASSVKQNNGRMFYYIDCTLHDLFNESSYGVNIPDRMKKLAIEQERENYRLAEKVISMGSWVHNSLRNVYGLDQSKIGQVLPGANIVLPKNFTPSNEHGDGKVRELVLGFIGKDWKRKGLPLLLDARDILDQRGYKVKVKVIGNAPEEIASRKGVVYSGFIDKRSEHAKFIETIASCDIGCLFSESEALGISVLEFLRVGVPVAGYATQGTLDTLLPGASIRFNPGDNAKVIAGKIASFIEQPAQLNLLREGARASMNKVTWDNTVSQWTQILKSK